jgi:hypothetical protein
VCEGVRCSIYSQTVLSDSGALFYHLFSGNSVVILAFYLLGKEYCPPPLLIRYLSWHGSSRAFFVVVVVVYDVVYCVGGTRNVGENWCRLLVLVSLAHCNSTRVT